MEHDFYNIADWLQQHAAPTRHGQFNPPATAVDLERAEARLGTFPDDMRGLYRLANGQPEQGATSLFGSFLLLSLDEILDAARFLNKEFPDGINVHDPDHAAIDADEGVQPVWWSSHWLPVMTNGGGDYVCLDLAPTDRGRRGQLLTYYHDETFRSRVASSFPEFLSELAARLASGKCYVHQGMIEGR